MSKKILKQLENLSDELIENIINTSDEEILKEVEEDYGDPLYESKRMKKILKTVINKLNKNKE